MPNTENINKLIDWISRDNGKHIKMQAFIGYVDDDDNLDSEEVTKIIDCHTAYCMCGAANLIRMTYGPVNLLPAEGDGFAEAFTDQAETAEWLGIGPYDADRLFYMHGYSRWRFDGLSPALRRQAALNVMTHLRDTGEVDWPGAVYAAENALRK